MLERWVRMPGFRTLINAVANNKVIKESRADTGEYLSGTSWDPLLPALNSPMSIHHVARQCHDIHHISAHVAGVETVDANRNSSPN